MSWQSLRIFFIVLVMTSPSKAFAENQFTGTYVADARPHELIYLALTQTKDSVAGVMTIVSPDGDGGVSNQTLPVRGTADGGTINLVAERFLSKLAVSGKKSDELIVLAFPHT